MVVGVELEALGVQGHGLGEVPRLARGVALAHQLQEQGAAGGRQLPLWFHLKQQQQQVESHVRILTCLSLQKRPDALLSRRGFDDASGHGDHAQARVDGHVSIGAGRERGGGGELVIVARPKGHVIK